MEGSYLDIINKIAAIANNTTTPQIRTRVFSILSNFKRIKNNYSSQFHQIFEKLQKSMIGKHQYEQDRVIKQFQQQFLLQYSGLLRVNAKQVSEFLRAQNQFSRESVPSLDQKLHKFFAQFLSYRIFTQQYIQISQILEQIYFVLDFSELQMTTMLKRLIVKHLSGNPLALDIQEGTKRGLNEFWQQIFSKYYKFKLIKRANDVAYNAYRETPEQAAFTQGKIIITLQKLPQRTEGNEYLNINKEFQIFCNGISQSKRRTQDKIVIFGRVSTQIQYADIAFSPQDRIISSINTMLFCQSLQNSFLVDASDHGNTSVCFSPDCGKIPLKQGMLVKFGPALIIEISKITYIQQEDLDELELEELGEQGLILSSVLQVKHLTGALQGTVRRLKTHSSQNGEVKTLFIVGRGGGGVAPDLLTQDPRSSGRHAFIRYLDNEWFIQDANSTNGTSVMLKTSQEQKMKQDSRNFHIFTSFDTPRREVKIYIDEYRFRLQLTYWFLGYQMKAFDMFLRLKNNSLMQPAYNQKYISDLQFQKAEGDSLILKLKVKEIHCNRKKILHPGAATAILDITTSVSAWYVCQNLQLTTSVNLLSIYHRLPYLGEQVKIQANAINIRQKGAMVEGKILKEEQVLAVCMQELFFIKNRKFQNKYFVWNPDAILNSLYIFA